MPLLWRAAGQGSKRPLDEDRPSRAFDQALQRGCSRERSAGGVEAGGPDADGGVAWRDGEYRARDRALAGKADPEGEVAAIVVMAGGEHQRVDAARARRNGHRLARGGV